MARRIPTLAIANHKGGVGKSTIATRIATEWAEAGRRVLLIDMDPQGGATLLLRGRILSDRETGAYESLHGDAQLADVAEETEHGPEIVGAGEMLARVELTLAAEIGRESALKRALSEAPPDRWDVVVLDCPPSLGLLLVNALTAATHVVVPTMPSLLSLAALRVFDEAMTIARKRLNRGLKLLGYVLNQADAREKALEEARDLLRNHNKVGLIGEVRVDARLRGMGALKVRDRAGEDMASLAETVSKRMELPEM
jgi:chromosome partitioning protein